MRKEKESSRSGEVGVRHKSRISLSVLLLLRAADCKDHEEIVSISQQIVRQEVQSIELLTAVSGETREVPEQRGKFLRPPLLLHPREGIRRRRRSSATADTRKPWEVPATRAYGGRFARSTY